MAAPDFRSARYWATELIDATLYEGAVAIDATMGNGGDTLHLCECVGPTGRVYAFDVQQSAIEHTQARLNKAGVQATLFCLGHEHMSEVIHESVDAIMFNLGWLPGAEHGITTLTETTLQAVNAALALLKPEGLLTICVYPGHEEGSREKHALLDWAGTLDPKRYDVMLKAYLNQPNSPPLMLAIKKNKQRKGQS